MSESGEVLQIGSPPRQYSAPAVVLLIAATAVVLIGGLYLLARDAPSAGTNAPLELPVASVDADVGCANFGQFWTTLAEVGVSPGAAAGVGNCRKAANGEWILPLDPADQRLPESARLTEGERQATSALRSSLIAETVALRDRMPATLERELNKIYDPVARPVTGKVRDGVPISGVRGMYLRYTQAFLLDPEAKELAAYVGWWMGQRMTAFQQFANSCVAEADKNYLNFACQGMSDALSIRFPPWPWDLENPVTIDEYLISVARSAT